jgi:hypothetical protein
VAARGTTADQRELSVALNRVGGVREARGDSASALASFEEFATLMRAVVAARGTPQDMRELGAALNGVGRIRLALGDLAGALACFEESDLLFHSAGSGRMRDD